MAFYVTDMDAIIAALEANGVKFHSLHAISGNRGDWVTNQFIVEDLEQHWRKLQEAINVSIHSSYYIYEKRT